MDKMFYACEVSRNFHTAWTRSGPSGASLFINPAKRPDSLRRGRRALELACRAMVGRQATILDLLAKKHVKPRTQARRSHRAADPALLHVTTDSDHQQRHDRNCHPLRPVPL